MVAGKHRSRTMRRVFRKVSGGAVHKAYELRRPSPARCHDTGVVLQGVARLRPRQLSKLSKTQRRPERPFGGVLSSGAARKRLITKARSLN